MIGVSLGPTAGGHPVLALRRALNERYARFAACAGDVDAQGRVFAVVALFLAGAMGLRALVVLWAGVPRLYTDLGALGSFALLAGLSVVAQRVKLAEAALLLRGGALFALAMPWMSALSVTLFHVGRAFPLVDAQLAAWDHRLGFDWLAYAAWFDSHDWLWVASQVAYDSVYAQFAVATLLLGFGRQATRLYTFVTAQVLTLTSVFAVAIFLPAIGAFEQAAARSAGFRHTDFITGDTMTASINWLRGSDLATGGITNDHLISFPSYHASCAMFFVWALWPFRTLRWASVALNLAMLAATPVQGSHYLVDVIAGAAIAAAWIAACRPVIAWVQRWTEGRATGVNERIHADATEGGARLDVSL